MLLKKIFFPLLTISLLSSCASLNKQLYVECTSRGTVSSNKNYYIAPPSPDMDYLEFQDYSNALKTRLAEIGFTEVEEEKADLCIAIDYFMEAKEITTSHSNNSTYSIVNSDVNINTSKASTANSSATSAKTGNTITSSAVGKSSSNTQTQIGSTQYMQGGGHSTTKYNTALPFHFIIECTSVSNGKPLFKVDMKCVLQNPSMAPNIVPWLCLVAKWYIGKSYSGIMKIQTDNFSQSYNLPECFNSDYWSIQYEYFGGTSTWIKEEPIK